MINLFNFQAILLLKIYKISGEKIFIAGPRLGENFLPDTTIFVKEIREIPDSRRKTKQKLNTCISIVEEMHFDTEWIQAFSYLWERGRML